MEVVEALQQRILSTLDRDGEIEDTTVFSDATGEGVDQQTVLGVLKRLEAHEVAVWRANSPHLTPPRYDDRWSSLRAMRGKSWS